MSKVAQAIFHSSYLAHTIKKVAHPLTYSTSNNSSWISDITLKTKETFTLIQGSKSLFKLNNKLEKIHKIPRTLRTCKHHIQEYSYMWYVRETGDKMWYKNKLKVLTGETLQTKCLHCGQFLKLFRPIQSKLMPIQQNIK